MRPFLILLLGGSVLAGTAHAAELRPFTTLTSGAVRIADLFDGALNPERVLGPAPAPGSQIVVEAAQLAAIARQFDVDWRPASNADTAVLERPGRPLPREAVMDGLRRVLAGAGVSDDADIQLPGWSPPMVPVDGNLRPEVGQLDYDPASGRFTAELSVVADGIAPIHARLAGQVQEMMTVPVLTRRLLPGEVIGPGDLHMARVKANDTQSELARLPAQAIGLMLRHGAMPGQPLRLAELSRPPLVVRGAIVAVALDQPGMTLSAEAQALDQGALGEHVRVLNPSSHAVLDAEVTGAGRVRVIPGSMPLSANARFNQVAAR